MMLERMKYNQEKRRFVNRYFWRTYDQKEIDYIEESGGILQAFEFKWAKKNKIRRPDEFFRTYPQSSYKVIDRDTIWDFIKE